jgi:DNA-binding NarL/FixJ family response regulator
MLIEKYSAYRPDVALCVTDWSDGSALANIQMVVQRLPELPVVTVSIRSVPVHLAVAIAAGVRGYVSPSGLPNLPDVLRLAAGGGFGCCTASIRELDERIGTKAILSARESVIAAGVAAGHTNAEIAHSLGLKTSTVNTHIERILRKINGRTRTDMATWWQRQVGLGAATDCEEPGRKLGT